MQNETATEDDPDDRADRSRPGDPSPVRRMAEGTIWRRGTSAEDIVAHLLAQHPERSADPRLGEPDAVGEATDEQPVADLEEGSSTT